MAEEIQFLEFLLIVLIWEASYVLQAVETKNTEVKRPPCIASAFHGKLASVRWIWTTFHVK